MSLFNFNIIIKTQWYYDLGFHVHIIQQKLMLTRGDQGPKYNLVYIIFMSGLNTILCTSILRHTMLDDQRIIVRYTVILGCLR